MVYDYDHETSKIKPSDLEESTPMIMKRIKHKSHPCEFLPEAEVNPSTWKTAEVTFSIHLDFLAIIINR